jgi:hypothetical protein
MSISRNEIIDDEPRFSMNRVLLDLHQGNCSPGATPARLLACQEFSIFYLPLWF